MDSFVAAALDLPSTALSSKKERKKTDNPRERWEDGTPPPHTQEEGQRLRFYPRGDWYTFYWDGSSADKVARRAVFPTLEHDDYDPGPLAERIRRDTGRDHSSDDFS